MLSSGKEFLISSINDLATCMEEMVLTHKLLRVSRSKQCTVGIVMLDALCAEGDQINLSQLLINELLQDASLAQKKVLLSIMLGY